MFQSRNVTGRNLRLTGVAARLGLFLGLRTVGGRTGGAGWRFIGAGSGYGRRRSPPGHGPDLGQILVIVFRVCMRHNDLPVQPVVAKVAIIAM